MQGAATGASIGSFIPGVGTLLGAGIGGLGGFLFGGGDDKPKENPEDQYTKMLQQSSEQMRQRAGQLGDQGDSAITPVLSQLRSLLSANPADLMDATRPERGRIIDQYDTARRAIATFSPRGGGVASTAAQSQFDQAESLADVTSTAKRDAVGQLSGLGVSLTGLGLSADQLASADLNTVINSILTREGLDVQKRGQSMEMWGGIGEAAGTILGDILLDDGGA